jgi:hypothetical protein
MRAEEETGDFGGTPPPVFSVRVASKGLMLDAASTLAGPRIKVLVFSVRCEVAVRATGKRVSGGQLTVESLKLNGRGEEERGWGLRALLCEQIG